ncbi:MAG: DUF952 domain-containing protein [Simkaniaceae bacterium]|nr:DUF952 domain-containing protein [Simkaniaceae bacterium]
MSIEQAPERLYKIVSEENWKASEGHDELVLSEMDREFIHLAKDEEQVKKVAGKFWKDMSYWLLTVDPSKFQEGRLVFEANHQGGDKYYHLHEGSIPMSAITESVFKPND